jgi:glycosyltransferase involved in cell wall biosynthesis
MKIMYIANSPMPSRSANSIHIIKMCEAFAKAGLGITLVIPSAPKNFSSKADIFNFYGIKSKFKIRRIFTLPGRGMAIFYLLAMFYSVFKGPNIIYTRQIEAAVLASISHIKFILEMHDYLTDRVDKFFFKRLSGNKYFLKLILISNTLKTKFMEYGFNGKKTKVLPDAVDIDIFNNKKNVNNKRIRIGYGGHLFKGRGVEIIETLASSMADLDFYLWGGTEDLIEYWKNRTKNAKNLYFKGFVKNIILAEELANCDILIMPYQKEVAVFGNKGNTVEWMSPMKMFEYMATGRPIISSNLPVIREILKNGYNAILVTYDDEKEWESEIRRLINNPGIAKTIGDNARNDVVKKYTWDIRVKEILEIL